jgi:hypothetical protein
MVLKNKIVVRCLDGRVLKGYTLDFVPSKDVFHLMDADDESKVSAISAKGLKALFFVKTFEGNKSRKPDPSMLGGRAGGLWLKVTFVDGEVIEGTTNAYVPGRKGFFLVPADRGDNNERAYIFADATRKIEVLPAASAVGLTANHAYRR